MGINAATNATTTVEVTQPTPPQQSSEVNNTVTPAEVPSIIQGGDQPSDAVEISVTAHLQGNSGDAIEGNIPKNFRLLSNDVNAGVDPVTMENNATISASGTLSVTTAPTEMERTQVIVDSVDDIDRLLEGGVTNFGIYNPDTGEYDPDGSQQIIFEDPDALTSLLAAENFQEGGRFSQYNINPQDLTFIGTTFGHLSGTLEQPIDLSNRNIQYSEFGTTSFVDFSGTNLSGSTLMGLRNVDMSEVVANGLIVTGDVYDTTFENATLTNPTFEGLIKDGNFGNARVTRGTFNTLWDCDLSEAQLNQITLLRGPMGTTDLSAAESVSIISNNPEIQLLQETFPELISIAATIPIRSAEASDSEHSRMVASVIGDTTFGILPGSTISYSDLHLERSNNIDESAFYYIRDRSAR